MGVVVRRGVCILAPTLEKPDITVQVGSEWTDLSSDAETTKITKSKIMRIAMMTTTKTKLRSIFR